MPRLHADYPSCQGYGNCVTGAADTFDVDDEGVVVLLRDTFAEGERSRIEDAVRSCPVNALSIEVD
ncbi:ferredoxin [Mycolicibacterium hippocampi]|uniref:Phthalate dioxygenase ferredoxin subunit n=1 Tax=Mycolicibacterium hippocampi TaxID=659824 RepID=A0A850PX97_9MYCO|nr:ferredoxin [Mycolicibacterium hippocampi]NVN53627.1 Phthalate dioxygenase ferredoxin subunit [Mycolicibacterium hippocampi]